MSREADKGTEPEVIEAGWMAFYQMYELNSMSTQQVTHMRNCFFAGAGYLFNKITTMLDPGIEPTNGDLAKMENIDRELKDFVAECEAAHHATQEAAKPQQLGDGPIEQRLVGRMTELGKAVDYALNGPSGKKKLFAFALLVAPFFDQKGRCNYISNANRDDVVALMKEQVARFEGSPDVIGHA